MSTWELITSIMVGRRDAPFTEEGLRRGLKDVLGRAAPDESSLYQTLLCMNGRIFWESSDFTYYRVTNSNDTISTHLFLLAERGYDSRRLERLQPVIDRVWEHAPYNNREYERRKGAVAV